MKENCWLHLSIVLAVAALVVLGAWRGNFASAGSAGPGDANCDGRVNSIDASLMLQFDAGIIHTLSCPDKADVNGDGRSNAIDASLVLQFDAGIISHLGQPQPTATRTRTPTPLPQQPTNTPTPTRTLPPQPTATPTNTPVVPQQTPTPATGSVTTRHNTTYTDSLGALWVVGEVYNGLAHEIELAQVSANFYSSSNVLLATENGFSCVKTLPSMSDSPYAVLLLGPPSGIDHVTVQVTQYFEPPAALDPAVIGLNAAVTNAYTDGFSIRHAVGTVTNNSPHKYHFVRPCVAFYDAAGNVVRTTFTLTEPADLGPTGTGTFDANVSSLGAAIVSQRVWVTADYADKSPPGPTPTPTSPAPGSGSGALVAQLPFLFLGNPAYSCTLLGSFLNCDTFAPGWADYTCSWLGSFWNCDTFASNSPDYSCSLLGTFFDCSTFSSDYPDYSCSPLAGKWACTTFSSDWPDYSCSVNGGTADCSTFSTDFPDFSCTSIGSKFSCG